MTQKETLALFSIRPDKFAGLSMVLGRTFQIVPLSESATADDFADQPISAAVVDGTPYRTFSREARRTLRSRPDGDRIAILEIVDPEVLNDPESVEDDAPANQMVASGRSTAAMLAAFWQACARREEQNWASEHESVSAAARQAKQAFSILEDITRRGTTDDPAAAREMFRETARLIARASGLRKSQDLLRAIETHHAYTFAHSLKVATLMTELGRAIGLTETDRVLLAEAGLLHDVGKLMVPIDVLAKPSRLTFDEFETMKTHAQLGEELLQGLYGSRPEIAIAAGQHHEKLDGSGYPNGLLKTQIHEIGRSCAIVDIYSALTDRRDYKDPMSSEDALAIMRPMAGAKLEERLFEVFESWVREELAE
ncbi:MAG: HD domain-containing protein [Alphaproteobacteria bacterium]|nr:HD domain-containing protein [Alphaproteobacteria bacterium]